MRFEGKNYVIRFEGETYEYSLRGEYGGTGYAYKGIAGISTKRDRRLATFRLGGNVSGPAFTFEKLFTQIKGEQHYDDFITPLRSREFVDIVASQLLTLYDASLLRVDEVLACVAWSGFPYNKAVHLGFIPDSSGQLMMRVGK